MSTTVAAPTTIYGLDFTSSPRPAKPITCAHCTLNASLLTVRECLVFTSFEAFESFLLHDGPWMAALDFPFGLPHKLLARLGWPESWEGYLRFISSLGRTGFEETLNRYRTGRPLGDKLHTRATDLLAGSRSPMMLHRVPVGKMFFEGAPRLLSAGVSILPCRPLANNRVVVEGYPALVARKWIGKRPYKSDERKKQTADQMEARQQLVAAICSNQLLVAYALNLDLPAALAALLIEDPMADKLDAVLCAIQATWAFLHLDRLHHSFDRLPQYAIEGWIVDPDTVRDE